MLIGNWPGEKMEGWEGSGRRRIFKPEGKTWVKAMICKWALDKEKQTNKQKHRVEHGE